MAWGSSGVLENGISWHLSLSRKSEGNRKRISGSRIQSRKDKKE
jgi:hypothetical protein